MALDEAFSKAEELLNELEPRLREIETEQDARFQLINRILVEICGWAYQDIKTEPHSASGYTDYLLSGMSKKRLVVEAKRTEKLTIDTLNPAMRTYRVGGPALASAMPGIMQAAQYCLDHGVDYAVVTTGVVWIAFRPFPGPSVSYAEGSAFVFPNFQAIRDNFATFYDLLSKEAVLARSHVLQFAKAEGLSLGNFEPLTSANRDEDARLLPQSPLAADLEPVFQKFFGSMSADSDREMLVNCFVETRESRFADASLEKIVRNVTASIAQLDPSSENLLAQEIEASVETGRGETVVIVGNNGAGKSTFLERFFDSVLEPSVRARCLVVRIDLLKSSGDLPSLGTWLTGEIKRNLELHLYEEGNPTYDELQGLYFHEYRRWAKGQFKPLYESDKSAFKIKFGEFLTEQLDRDPYGYVLRLLSDIVKNRKLLPCLIFDNCDHFPDLNFQEAVFQFSQAIHGEIPFTFIVMPITDRSFWRLSKGGPFQTYHSKKFYLPVPPTKEVLEKRVAYLKRKIEENESQRQYFLTHGIRLSLENIEGFAACLEEVFLREDFVARRISWLANNNLRKSLEIAQKIITSPFFSIEDLITAYVTNRAQPHMRLHYRKFMKAILLGNYNVFRQDHNDYVLNVFAISPHHLTTPLLNLSILKILIDRAGEGDGVASYMLVEQVRQYLESMGLTDDAINHALILLLTRRLVEPYDASSETIEQSERVAITHSGRMHYEMATNDGIYLTDTAYSTPVRSPDLVEFLRSLRERKMGADQWHAVESQFMCYCLDQDALFARIPRDEIFEGQRQLRQVLRLRWAEQRDINEVSPEDKETADASLAEHAGYSHVSTIVKWYDSNRGYGFVEAGLGEDVFVHYNLLQEADIDQLAEGDTLVCDIARSPRGKLQAIAIHSIERAAARVSGQASEAQLVAGVVEFYNKGRGYGFIRTSSTVGDVYISAKTLEDNGYSDLEPQMSVKIAIEPSRFGKGFVATSILVTSDASVEH